MTFERLGEEHLPMVDAFCCVETDEMLHGYNSAARKRIRKHSREMERFFKEEALSEQENGMSTTYVMLSDDSSQIIAYLSLCNDAIHLEFQERADEGITYHSAPSLKIARLAVHTEQMGHGYGRLLVERSAAQAVIVREFSGVCFLTLDCYEHRLPFYEHFGFVKNLHQPVQLEYDSPISMRIRLDTFLESIVQRYEPF